MHCNKVGYDLFRIHEAPLHLIDIPQTNAETISYVIKTFIVGIMLPFDQCRGQAYANMSGHINGVAAKLQEIEPRVIYVHCLAHCTNLSLQQVGRQVLCIHEALNLVMELSHYLKV